MGQVRWPVNRVCVRKAYKVSRISQRNPTRLHIADLKELRKLIKEVKAENEQGLCQLEFHKNDLERLVLVTYLDASYAKEPGSKSQAGFVTIATTHTAETDFDLGTIIEFQSSTIRRVTGSCMASEAAALSLAIDRQLYARVLLQSIIHGEPSFSDEWRNNLTIPGILVTDAKSLFDHLNKTGSIPRERQTLLDLLAARELVEGSIVKVKWVSTLHDRRCLD